MKNNKRLAVKILMEVPFYFTGTLVQRAANVLYLANILSLGE